MLSLTNNGIIRSFLGLAFPNLLIVASWMQSVLL